MAYNELTVFINQILDEKGLPEVDDEVRQQLVEDMTQRLLDQINRAIVEAIPEAKLEEFEKIATTAKSDDKLQKFFADNGVDTQAVTVNTMVNFKNLYLGQSK
jgi:hypothetical protein